ncbi:hypothetical protein COLO4_15712 [Corchorus olitorius]|uniref:RNase H type-1 domain-containing protein n=1 Tax=Corchorus olitorius TaxID=93759 RepID=A0A1R3JLQ3_9ROSI|nr:hypothetical protein COLO4_15712 [Corchorus olitorius]
MGFELNYSNHIFILQPLIVLELALEFLHEHAVPIVIHRDFKCNKLNTDGSWNQLNGNAGAGGIFRNMEIHYANEKRVDKLIIESDSLNTVKLITEGCNQNHPYFYMISNIREIVMKHTDWKMNYVPRQKNCCADWIAKWSLSKPLGLLRLDSPPEQLLCLIMADVVRVGHPVFIYV